MRVFVGLVVVLASCIALCLGYSTSGNKILDPSGNVIILRGVARPSLEWDAAGERLSLSDYNLMKGWGANVVRLSLNQCFWNGNTNNYKTTVEQQVEWIKGLKMGVILDLHWSQGSGSSCGQQTMPDDQSTTFWSSVATKYKNDAWVIFELYNEPHDVSWSVWKYGGNAGGFNTPGFQKLYNTVRDTGANNVVIVAGLNYAYDLSGVPSNKISGSNITYSSHPYDYYGKQQGDWPGNFNGLLSTDPIIVTEFGEYNCNPTYVNQWLAYADANCISWTAWAWYAQGCGFPSIISDWAGTPSAVGNSVKTALSKAPKCASTSSGSSTTQQSSTSTTKQSSTSSSTSTATTTTTTTTGSSSNTKQIYTDSVLSPFQDRSWGAVKNSNDRTQKYSGTSSYSFVPASWSAIYIYNAGGFNPSLHKSIEFYIRSGSANPAVNFNMITFDGANSHKIGPDNRVASYCGYYIPANSWVKCTVHLSSFPAQSYDGFFLIDQTHSSTTGFTVYVDSVTLIGK